MKTRFRLLILFIGAFMLTQSAISATWTRTGSNHTFSFTGTTVSTSRYLAGRGTPVHQVTGSADISGTADALGDNTVYKAELWLMVSGDITTSSFPGKGNINKKRIEDSVFYDTHTSGAAKISYTSHPVGSLANFEGDPTQAQTQKSLTRSLSSSYVDTDPTSPTGLSASPEVYGSLSGTIMNHVGNKSVTPLTFRSEDNPATGDAPDDGGKQIAAEICQRAGNCGKPFTATSSLKHRVDCPDKRYGTNVLLGAIGIWRQKQEDCTGKIWTCANPPVCPFVASHVPASELKLKVKYVDKDGNTVDPSTVNRPCGHLLSASGDHSLQASCSSSNANGNCEVTSFYACDSHTHVYPTPSPAPTPTPSPAPTPTPSPAPTPTPPPAPTTVACGGASYTGCSGASSRTEHHVPLCSNGCGNGYWTCGQYAYRHTTQNTCRRAV